MTGVAAFLKALASILGSLSGFATIGRRFAAWVMRRRLRQVLASARRTHDWLDFLLAAYRPHGGCQVALLRTRNGGGLPMPGRPLYGDLVDIAQDHAEGLDPLRRKDWSGQEVDGPYRELVEEVHRRRNARVLTRDLAPGQLRDAYESRSLSGAMLWSVGHTPDGFLYVSVGFRGAVPADITAQVRDRTRRAITGLAKEQDAWLYAAPPPKTERGVRLPAVQADLASRYVESSAASHRALNLSRKVRERIDRLAVVSRGFSALK